MNAADAVAFCAMMVTVIVLAGLMVEGRRIRGKNRLAELELRVRLAEAEKAGGGAIPSELEERVRVLERIATDPAPRLAGEIESLRTKELAK